MKKKNFLIFLLQILFFVTLFEFIFPTDALALCLPTTITSNCVSGTTNCNNNLGSTDGNNPGYCEALWPGISCAEVIDAGGGFYQTVCFGNVGVPSPTPGAGCGKLGIICCQGPNYCDPGLEPTSTGGAGSCICQNPASPIPTRIPAPTGTSVNYLPIADLSSLGTFQKTLDDDDKNNTISLPTFLAKGITEGLVNTGILGMFGTLPVGNSLINYEPSGVIGLTTNLIGSMYSNPPVSGSEYLADLGQSFGIIKPIYAQGIGFSGLSNILPLWKAFRNISYLLFVIVFVVMGLAIMFRMKISPQAVVTLESALPRIIISLILVTFSYAIAGLLIDLIYVLITLGIVLVGQTGWINIAQEQQKYLSLSFFDGMGLFFGSGVKAIFSLLGGWLGSGIVVLIIGVITVANPVIGGLLIGLPLLILGIMALYAMFKLFFALLSCYINIIISVITAPIQIITGVLPGNEMGFNSWVKNLLANILAFPAVAIFLLLGWLLSGQHGPTWSPPVLSMGGGKLTAFIGFGMLLMAPKIPEMVKSFLQPKSKPSPSLIGETLGAPKQLIGTGIQTISTLGGLDKSLGGLTGGKEGILKNTAQSVGTFIRNRGRMRPWSRDATKPEDV